MSEAIQNSYRSKGRVRISLPVRYGVDRADQVAEGENVSEGGIYLNTNDVHRVGTRLVVAIEFPEGTVTRHGEVMWAIRVPEHLRHTMVCGMGISFVDGDTAWREFYRRWFESVANGYSPK